MVQQGHAMTGLKSFVIIIIIKRMLLKKQNPTMQVYIIALPLDLDITDTIGSIEKLKL